MPKLKKRVKDSLFILLGAITLVSIVIFLNQFASKQPVKLCTEFSPIENTSSIAILTYHHILSDEDIKNYSFKDNKWTISTSRFEEQLNYLKENGYQTITLKEFYNWYQNKMFIPNKTVVITFDDGYKSTIQYAVPLLKKYGFTATNFIIGKTIQGMYMNWDPSILQYVCNLDLHDSTITNNMQFYSHTFDGHNNNNGKPAYLSFSREQIIEDLNKSKELNSIDFLAYPFGASNDNVHAFVKEAGVKMAFDYGSHKHAEKTDDPMNIPRYSINPNTSLQEFINLINPQ